MVIKGAALVRRSSPWQRNVLVVTGLEPSISAQVGAEPDVVKANPEVFLFWKNASNMKTAHWCFFYKSGLKFGISKVPSSDHTTVYPIISHDIYGYYIRNFQFSNPSLLQLDNAKRRFLSKFCLSGAMGASRGTVLVRQMSGGKPVAEPWCRCEWLVAGCCRKESSKTAKKHIFTAWKCCLLGPCVSEEGNHLESSGTSK